MLSAHRPSCCYRGTQHEEPPVLLPGRGHPRLRQRKQGAGDPHRSVVISLIICVFVVSFLFIFFNVCLKYILPVHLRPDRLSKHQKLFPSFEFKPTVHFGEACVYRNGTRRQRYKTKISEIRTEVIRYDSNDPCERCWVMTEFVLWPTTQ